MDKKVIAGIATAGLSVVGTLLGIVVNSTEIFKMFKKDDTPAVVQQEVTTIADTTENIETITTALEEIAETETLPAETIETEVSTKATEVKTTEATKSIENTTEATTKANNKPYIISNISSFLMSQLCLYVRILQLMKMTICFII